MTQKLRDKIAPSKASMATSEDRSIYTFEVRSLQEGLEQIKQQLGEHAMFLSTKRLPNGMLEIVVGKDSAPEATAEERAKESGATARGAVAPLVEGDATVQIFEQLKQVQAELRQLRLERALRPSQDEARLGSATWEKGLENLRKLWPTGFIEALGQLRQRLLDAGVEHPEVDALTIAAISTTEDIEGQPAIVWRALEQVMMRALKRADAPWDRPFKDDRPQLHVMVGCSGVGKTTLAAKVTAYARYVAKLPTTMLAADAYRIGGLYQLRAYGELIEVPVIAASSEVQLRSAIRMSGPQSVLVVDTCGSWGEEEGEAPGFWSTLSDIADVHIHLVFSVTASASQVMHQLASLGVEKPSSVILTHWDELWAQGPVFSMLYRMGLPVSLISSGRQVPEALDPFEPEALVKHILGR